MDKIQKSEEDWKKELTAEEFRVLRKKGTEPVGSGKYIYNKKEGKYYCAACGNELFSSEAKFDTKCGWPSFSAPVDEKNIKNVPDNSLFIARMEVECSRCGSHLGHVFNDGPQPTGKRFCINSVALKFKEKEE